MSSTVSSQSWRTLSRQGTLLLEGYRNEKNDYNLWYDIIVSGKNALTLGISILHATSIEDRRGMALIPFCSWFDWLKNISRYRSDVFVYDFDTLNPSIAEWVLMTFTWLEGKNDQLTLNRWVEHTYAACSANTLGIDELYNFFIYCRASTRLYTRLNMIESESPWMSWCHWCSAVQLFSEDLCRNMRDLAGFDDDYRLLWLKSIFDIENALQYKEISCF